MVGVTSQNLAPVASCKLSNLCIDATSVCSGAQHPCTLLCGQICQESAHMQLVFVGHHGVCASSTSRRQVKRMHPGNLHMGGNSASMSPRCVGRCPCPCTSRSQALVLCTWKRLLAPVCDGHTKASLCCLDVRAHDP